MTSTPRIRSRQVSVQSQVPRQRPAAPATGTAPTSEEILNRIRANQRLGIDATIDRALETGEPAQPIPAEIDMAEEQVGRHMTGLSEDPAFQKEYRYRLLHRMLMRQLPMNLIARTLNVSVRSVYTMREKLFAQLREEASNKDLPTYVGMTDGFYNDIIGQCLRMASGANTTDIRKLGALQVALQAQRDRTHFYEVVGFHDVLKISPVSGMFDRATDQASKLGKMAETFLSAFNDGLDESVEGYDAFEQPVQQEEQIRTRVL